MSSLQRSNDLDDLTSSSSSSTTTTTATNHNTNSTSFAPLHRTAELENLHEHMNNDDEKQIPSTTTTKKVLTKCITVIGDGSDKQN